MDGTNAKQRNIGGRTWILLYKTFAFLASRSEMKPVTLWNNLTHKSIRACGYTSRPFL
jgi:hypothetical protein